LSSETWREFFESSKYKNLGETDENKGLTQPLLELPYDKAKPVVILPRPSEIDIGPCDVKDAIEARSSIRDYSKDLLTLKELSWLLWCTQGVKKIVDRPATLRTVPSAGARHPFETYLLINRIEGIKPGLYRFLAIDHKLLEVDLDEGLVNEIAEANWSMEMLKKSGVIFIWVAVQYRMTYRYGNRGYRYMYLDAGHVCQNLYLAAEAIDCGTCAVGGFYDDRVNCLLDLDGEELFVIYMAPVGKKK
jgi:SagB-type dehydrogenase family enzyme